MTNPTAQISKLTDIRSFITAGNALFTLVSKRTGKRKTFLAEAKPDATGAWFVRLLVGPENTDSYKYLGFMYESGRKPDLLIRPNKQGWGREAYDVFSWMLSKINGYGTANFFEEAEFWHAGRCGRCGRTLTVPESIATGIGPVCAGRE